MTLNIVALRRSSRFPASITEINSSFMGSTCLSVASFYDICKRGSALLRVTESVRGIEKGRGSRAVSDVSRSSEHLGFRPEHHQLPKRLETQVCVREMQRTITEVAIAANLKIIIVYGI
jgi:hypothetical protein